MRVFLSSSAPLNHRLSILVMSTASIALLVAAFGFIGQDVLTYKRSLETDLVGRMAIVGQSASAALQFGDPMGAEEALNPLQTDPAMWMAVLFGADGSTMAHFQQPDDPGALVGSPPTDAYTRYTRTHVDVYQPIVFEGESVGGLYIRYSLAPFFTRLQRYLGITFVVLMLSVGVAFIISRRLKRSITEPILNLTCTAKSVTEQKDYTVRAKRMSDGELGLLAETFNTMLSEIQQRDAQLAAHRDHLEEQVQARTIELKAANTSLRTEKERAEAANRLKTLLLTNMTHEFRTPVAGIVSIAAVLQEEVGFEQREFLEMVEASGYRLMDTLNAVLNLARLETADVQFMHQALHLQDQLARILPAHQRRAEQKHLTLHIDQSRMQHPVWLDASALDFIAASLLSNAIKFTERGEISMQFATTDDAFSITVQDTGIGIGEAFLPHIYEPFKQESTGLARSYEGSGIGLTIVRRTTDMLGGTITVETAQGSGTTFTVTLPRDARAHLDTATELTLGQLLA
ncbi:MAG: ATP-binding protein [Bacteroidota bacterium]